MQINPTKWLLIIVAALIVFLLVTIQTCNSYKNKAGNAEAQYEYLFQKIDSLKNEQGKTIAEQKVAITTSEKVIKDLSAQVFDLRASDAKRVKEVESLVRVIQNFHPDTIFVPYNQTDTVLVKDSGSLHVPTAFHSHEKDYQIDGTVYLNGVQIDNILVHDTVSTRIIVQKQGLFKRPKEVLQIIHSNPVVSTYGAQAMILQHPTSKWNKWIKPVLAAALTGFLEYKLRK
jgi:hypothetical protein